MSVYDQQTMVTNASSRVKAGMRKEKSARPNPKKRPALSRYIVWVGDVCSPMLLPCDPKKVGHLSALLTLLNSSAQNILSVEEEEYASGNTRHHHHHLLETMENVFDIMCAHAWNICFEAFFSHSGL